MKELNEKEIRKLKVGDRVIYHERSGQLNPYFYKAKVIGIYPNFITLSVAASKYSSDSYEDAKNYFTTSFCYNDGIPFGFGKLYKDTFSDFLIELDKEIENEI